MCNFRGEISHGVEADKAPCGQPSFEQFMVAAIIPLEVSEADMSRLEKLYYERMTIECSEEQDWTQFDALVKELGITWKSGMVEICEPLILESFEELMAAATIPEGVTKADIQRLEQLYFETVCSMTGDMSDASDVTGDIIDDWTRFDDLTTELGIEFNIRNLCDVNSEQPVVESGILMLNPRLTEVYEKLGNASSDLIAMGVPLVDFSLDAGSVDTETGFANIVILVGFSEVKEEYKESVKAIVEGAENPYRCLNLIRDKGTCL